LNRKYFDQGLYFPPMKNKCTLVTFTDASWATRHDSSSQGGQITLLMEEGALSGCKTPFHVISWSSRRLKRVARSSTSAETQMCANALDLHEFIKLSLLELESPKPLVLANLDLFFSRWKTCMIVDAKNVFDAVCKIETAGLQKKRGLP